MGSEYQKILRVFAGSFFVVKKLPQESPRNAFALTGEDFAQFPLQGLPLLVHNRLNDLLKMYYK